MNNQINVSKTQEVILKDRKSLFLSGIEKLISLNSDEFVVLSVLGTLTIKGNNLEMESLDIDNGKMNLKGEIYLIEYSNTVQKPKEKSFLAKVFR